jgi:hypothetical protein
MEYIEGKITSSGKKRGYIILSNKDRTKAKIFFRDFIGQNDLSLATNEGVLETISFRKETRDHRIYIYSKFFRTLQVDDVIYLQVKDENTILITNTEPNSNLSGNILPVNKKEITAIEESREKNNKNILNKIKQNGK